MLEWIGCLLRELHRPVRHPLGGFRCANCGTALADLEEAGFKDGGWVGPLRTTFKRGQGGGVTREEWR